MMTILLLSLLGNTRGEPSDAKLHKEALNYENIELKTRSYK